MDWKNNIEKARKPYDWSQDEADALALNRLAVRERALNKATIQKIAC